MTAIIRRWIWRGCRTKSNSLKTRSFSG
jgi:hypothetical protein